jgi:purine nucleosidase
MQRQFRVVFDTDIGTDVDDALALAVLLGRSPEVRLEAVTTVYGDTLLRARLAQRYARLAGRSLRVHTGEAATRSGRDVWWAGHEGTLHSDLESEPVEPEHGVDALIDIVLSAPGQIDVIAVGPLTNVAAAIEREPGFAAATRHLWVMGGAFDTGENEHNVRSDVDSARIVFAAGIPTTVASLDVTQRLAIGEEQLTAIADSGPLGAALQRDIQQWWAYWNEPWNVPHDPVAVLALLDPAMFAFSAPGTVTVTDDGVTSFAVGPGATRLITDLDPDAVGAAIIEAVIAAHLPGEVSAAVW